MSNIDLTGEKIYREYVLYSSFIISIYEQLEFLELQNKNNTLEYNNMIKVVKEIIDKENMIINKINLNNYKELFAIIINNTNHNNDDLFFHKDDLVNMRIYNKVEFMLDYLDELSKTDNKNLFNILMALQKETYQKNNNLNKKFKNKINEISYFVINNIKSYNDDELKYYINTKYSLIFTNFNIENNFLNNNSSPEFLEDNLYNRNELFHYIVNYSSYILKSTNLNTTETYHAKLLLTTYLISLNKVEFIQEIQHKIFKNTIKANEYNLSYLLNIFAEAESIITNNKQLKK